MELLKHSPQFSTDEAASLALKLYGLRASASPLPSERDLNFLLSTEDGRKFVLKIANGLEERALLHAQNQAMTHLADRLDFCPRIIRTTRGEEIGQVESASGSKHFIRLVTYLPGTPLGNLKFHSYHVLSDLGRKLGLLDSALVDFDDPAFHRDFHWDLANGLNVIREYRHLIKDSKLAQAIDDVIGIVERDVAPVMPTLRRSLIHGDANDHNVLVSESPTQQITGVIDFGDMVYSYTVGDLAVALAYVVLGKPDPQEVARTVIAGYREYRPLEEIELNSVWPLMLTRLCMSVCLAAHQQAQQPDNEYLQISQEAIQHDLPNLVSLDWKPVDYISKETIENRRKLIGPSLRLSYKEPLKIVRGSMQYLYGDDGREYLDAYNNVAHVGHCHPRVVQAGQEQMAKLNTNTRYLHDFINQYAERLTATLPGSLKVCYFVNSGSEANELALRLAQAHTHQRDLIVLDQAYHGNTTTMIDISPYKHDGPGGRGAPSWVHKAPLPDLYRGLYRRNDQQASEKYSEHIREVVDKVGHPAGFIAESLPSVAGQIVLPSGYLNRVYKFVRAAGGVCIADEVQTGYGRTGSHFWGFESQDVVPDIVVLGKPIGNGHPIGAVVTTPEIAASFDNGMEFFSTFGGNTVSCAIGLAVLDVALEENLQAHAGQVGEKMRLALRQLMNRNELIGDVRGSGLFLGVELVRDRVTLEPATEEADTIVNEMRRKGILIGTDGQFHNVLKIRPPMPFSASDADRLVGELDKIMGSVA